MNEKLKRQILRNREYLANFSKEMQQIALDGNSEKLVNLSQSISEVSLKIEILEGLLIIE